MNQIQYRIIHRVSVMQVYEEYFLVEFILHFACDAKLKQNS